MNEEKSLLGEVFSVSHLFAALGAALVLVGSFLEIVRFSALSYSYPVYLKDLNIDSLLMMLRIVSFIAAVILFIPKMPGIVYTALTLVLMVLFVPKAYDAYNIYLQAGNILKALGITNFIDIQDFLNPGWGYRLLFVGFLIMLGCSIYFAVRFFMPKRESM